MSITISHSNAPFTMNVVSNIFPSLKQAHTFEGTKHIYYKLEKAVILKIMTLNIYQK